MKILLLFILSFSLFAHPVRPSNDQVSDQFLEVLQEGYDNAIQFIDGKMEIPACQRVWVQSSKTYGPSAIYYFLNCFIKIKEGFNFGTGPLEDRHYQAVLSHELGHALFTTMKVKEEDVPMWANFKERRRIERHALYNKRRMSELRKMWSNSSLSDEEKTALHQEYNTLRDDPIMKEYRQVTFKEKTDKAMEILITPYTELFADLFAVALFQDLDIMQEPLPESSSDYDYRTFDGELYDIELWDTYGSYAMFAPIKRYVGANFDLNMEFVLRFLDLLDSEMNFICSQVNRYPKYGEYAYQRETFAQFIRQFGMTSNQLNRRLLEQLAAW